MISELLGRGKGAALTMNDLKLLTGYSRRDIQKQIALERESGELILSSTQPPGGYYLPSCSAELEEYVRSMDARAKATFAACQAARKALREMEAAEQGQIAIEENAPDGSSES